MDNVYTAARPFLSAGQPPEDRRKPASWGPSRMMNVSPVMIQIRTTLARARVRARELRRHLNGNLWAQGFHVFPAFKGGGNTGGAWYPPRGGMARRKRASMLGVSLFSR